MQQQKSLVNILVIEENRTLYEELTRELDSLLPSHANVVCCADLARGAIDIKEMGFFHIVVMGTEPYHTDQMVKRRLDIIEQASRRKIKLVLFVAKTPDDPITLGVNHIVQKPSIHNLALAISPLVECFDEETLKGWMTS